MLPNGINVLNPVVSDSQIAAIAECMNENNIDYRHILDIATSLGLVDLLSTVKDDRVVIDEDKYQYILQGANKAGNFLIEYCVNDKQRLLAITFLLKAMVNCIINDKL